MHKNNEIDVLLICGYVNEMFQTLELIRVENLPPY